MSFMVKTCRSHDEMRAALTPMASFFGFEPDGDFIERLSRVLPPERVAFAEADGGVVAGAASYPLVLTIPGGAVPASALSWVAVLPTHRRRGVLTAMMRAHLDACRARGEPAAYLWASEDAIYGRFGFGFAGQMGEIEIERGRAAFHAAAETAPAGDVRIVPLAEAEPLVAPIYDRVAAVTPGAISRSPAWWQTRNLVDHPWLRRGGGLLQCAVLSTADGPAAYALYRLNMFLEHGVNGGHVAVVEAMGTTPAATSAIWRFLFDIDWLHEVRAWRLPVDHPLHLLLEEPRRLNFSVRDGVWVRLVDVGAALAARGWADGEPVVIEIADDFCPDNAGRWRIGAGGAARTGTAADLACDVAALASAYLGGFSWERLVAGLRATELRPGAAARADAVFRTARAPWCPEIF